MVRLKLFVVLETENEVRYGVRNGIPYLYGTNNLAKFLFLRNSKCVWSIEVKVDYTVVLLSSQVDKFKIQVYL